MPDRGKGDEVPCHQAPREVDSVTLQKQALSRKLYQPPAPPLPPSPSPDLGFSVDDSAVSRLITERAHVPRRMNILRAPAKLIPSKREMALEKIAKPRFVLVLCLCMRVHVFVVR